MVDELPSADPNEQLADDGTGTIIKKPKSSRNVTRRQMSKSEPTGHLEESSNDAGISYDGSQDANLTAAGCGEGQPFLPGVCFPAPLHWKALIVRQQRHVSAPSDAPHVPPRSRSRPKRSRHWRLKSRASESHGSGTTSGTPTGDETNIPVLTQAPLARTPSQDSQATTTIRFAPGC